MTLELNLFASHTFSNQSSHSGSCIYTVQWHNYKSMQCCKQIEMAHKYSLTSYCIAHAAYFTSGFVIDRNAHKWLCCSDPVSIVLTICVLWVWIITNVYFSIRCTYCTYTYSMFTHELTTVMSGFSLQLTSNELGHVLAQLFSAIRDVADVALHVWMCVESAALSEGSIRHALLNPV